MMRFMTKDSSPTAAALIIGNEILSGRTADQNIVMIARKMAALGLCLCEVRIVPDERGMIVDALNILRRTYAYVFTTGGIGPTHDDITMEAFAEAFGVPLIEHPQALKELTAYYGGSENMNPARRRMALVPEGATLVDNAVTAAPGVRMDNVFALAGVPEVMRSMLDALDGLLSGGPPLFIQTVRCEGIPESLIADELRALAEKMSEVEIGSYPTFQGEQIGLALVMKGMDDSKVREAAEKAAAFIRAKGGAPKSMEGY